jgi:hypothetical protein
MGGRLESPALTAVEFCNGQKQAIRGRVNVRAKPSNFQLEFIVGLLRGFITVATVSDRLNIQGCLLSNPQGFLPVLILC